MKWTAEAMGKKGGEKSKRKLTPEESRRMNKIKKEKKLQRRKDK